MMKTKPNSSRLSNGCPTSITAMATPRSTLQLEAGCSDLRRLHADQYLQVHLQTQQGLSTAVSLKKQTNKKIILPLI